MPVVFEWPDELLGLDAFCGFGRGVGREACAGLDDEVERLRPECDFDARPTAREREWPLGPVERLPRPWPLASVRSRSFFAFFAFFALPSSASPRSWLAARV